MKMKKIAFFDFDGTITTDDSLIKFIRHAVGDKKTFLGLAVLSPMLVAYKLKIIPNYKAKQFLLSYFFKGMSEERFKAIARDYSLRHIDTIVRPEAMERIAWHKSQGHKVVVVSASLECWLKPWCEREGLELLATKIKIKDGNVSGRLLSKNCYGVEKVNRIKARYDLDSCETIYAYGDSRGDREMLAIAHKAYYKPFRKK
jgi:HAD superfamily hydrolase (TIGR01490 family)